MTRTHTPTRRNPDGSRAVTIQRYCNGCDAHLGDATDTEVDAAIAGRALPDVRSECFACSPQTADCPACDQPAIERCVGCGSCACDRHDTCTREQAAS